MKPQPLYKVSLLSALLLLTVILNLVLAALIWRKRKIRLSDPIQTSIAAARQQTKQLNRINLISFMMVLQFLLTNIPVLVAPSIYWSSAAQGFINFQTAKLIAKIVDIIALFFIASRAYIVGLVSPKIRKEAWLALKCQPETTRAQQLGIDIRPQRFKIGQVGVTMSSEDKMTRKQSYCNDSYKKY